MMPHPVPLPEPSTNEPCEEWRQRGSKEVSAEHASKERHEPTPPRRAPHNRADRVTFAMVEQRPALVAEERDDDAADDPAGVGLDRGRCRDHSLTSACSDCCIAKNRVRSIRSR